MKAFVEHVNRSSVTKAPHPLPENDRMTVFLAGSIDMGSAENWQERAESLMRSSGFNILNPRRDDWDSSWKQTIKNDKFVEQVEWELTGMDRSDAILVYFDPKGKAPITLLEIGLHASSGKLFICCPDGFWKKGNVEVVCKRYSIPLFEALEPCVKAVIEFKEKNFSNSSDKTN